MQCPSAAKTVLQCAEQKQGFERQGRAECRRCVEQRAEGMRKGEEKREEGTRQIIRDTVEMQGQNWQREAPPASTTTHIN